MLKDFKKFLMKGDILDLAVAVILGVAFNAVIKALVDNVLMPIIGIVFGKPSFNDLTVTLNKSVIQYGSFLSAVVNFVIIGFSLFVVMQAYDKMQARRKASGEDAEEPSDEIVLLTQIRDALQQR